MNRHNGCRKQKPLTSADQNISEIQTFPYRK